MLVFRNDADTLDGRFPVFILSDRIDADVLQFCREFVGQAIQRIIALEGCIRGSACHDGTIDNRSEFITGHHAVTIEVSIRIAFDNAELMKLGNVFVEVR